MTEKLSHSRTDRHIDDSAFVTSHWGAGQPMGVTAKDPAKLDNAQFGSTEADKHIKNLENKVEAAVRGQEVIMETLQRMEQQLARLDGDTVSRAVSRQDN